MLHETIQNNQKWSSHHQPKQCMPRNDALQQLPVPLLQSLSRFCFRDTKRPQGLPAEGSRWIHPRRSADEFQVQRFFNTFQHFPNDRLESFLPFTECPQPWLSRTKCRIENGGALGGAPLSRKLRVFLHLFLGGNHQPPNP